MNKHHLKPIGIIGGMGPYASAYFYQLLLNKSRQFYRGLQNNDEYPEILIDSVPVPYFLEDTQKLAVAKNMLLDRTRKLNRYGVSTIAMICNTGHILHEELARASTCPFISLITEVTRETAKQKLQRVGILATPTTIRTDLYGRQLNQVGLNPVYADQQTQQLHVDVIKLAVAGQVTQLALNHLVNSTHQFVKKNLLDGLILACTELPLVFPKNRFKNLHIIDCLDVLADSLLVRYYHKETI